MTKMELMTLLFRSPLARELGLAEFSVLGYYCARANDLTGESWASASTIASELGIGTRNIQRAKEALVKRGYLTKCGTRPTVVNGKTIYTAAYAVAFQKLQDDDAAQRAIRRNAPYGATGQDATAQNDDATAQQDQMLRRSAPYKSVIESNKESIKESVTPDGLNELSPFEKWWQEYPAGDKNDNTHAESLRLWQAEQHDQRAAAMMAHLAECKLCRKWQDGFPQSPVNYLKSGMWKYPPPPPPAKSKREKHLAEYAQTARALPDAGEGDAVEQARNRLVKALNLTDDEAKAFTKELHHEFDPEYIVKARPGSNFAMTTEQMFGLCYDLTPEQFEGVDKAAWCSAELERRIARGLSWVLAAKIATLPPTTRDPPTPVAEQLREYRIARLREKGIEPEQQDQPPAPPTPEELAERERKRRRDETLNTIGHRGRQNLLKALCQKQPDKADDWRHRDIYLDNELRDRLYELHQAGQTRECVAHAE